MFYVCIATEEKPYRSMYHESFEHEKDRDQRARWLKYECYIHDGASWKLWTGEEPFESAVARVEAPVIEGETPEDRQIRLDALALKAKKFSTAVAGEIEIDDEPEWHKRGFSNQASMDLSDGKITQDQYAARMSPHTEGKS